MTPSKTLGSLLRCMCICMCIMPLLAACGAEEAVRANGDVAAASVTRRTLKVTITEKGSLKARNQILIRPDIPGQAKILKLADEGAQVKAGEVLCELDATTVEKEVSDLQNRVIALQGEVTTAEAELAIQLSQNEADIADDQLRLKFARVELERFEKGEMVQETSRRKVRVESAISERERARKKYEQMPALLEEGFVTATQVEEERINKLKAENEVELAELDVKTYLTYTAPMQLDERRSDVRKAELELDRTRQRALARQAQKESGLERQRRELSNVQARLDQAEETLANMVIRAPGDGIVIYGDARRPNDDREIKVGEMVYSGQPFLTLPDLSEMQVVVSVHEADVSRVKEGQTAFVTVETARDRPLTATVTRVSPVAASQGRRWYDQTKRFEVDLTLVDDITGMLLKPGLTANVEILVDELTDVLAVPAQAVFSQRGKFHVFTAQTGGAASRAPVEIAAGNSQYVVITSGVAEGDRVLLYNPESVAGEGAAARPDEPAEDGDEEGERRGRDRKP